MREHRAGWAQRAASIVGGLGAVAVLAACGGGGSASSSSSPAGVAGAASSTASAGATTTTSGGRAPAASLAELTQRAQAATRAAGTTRMSLASGPSAAAAKPVAKAQIRFRSKGSDMALELLGATRAKVVVLGGTVYFSTGEAIGGKHWIKIDPAGKDPVSKSVAPLLSSMTGNVDATAQLARMPGARLASVTATTLGGVPVTKYVVTMTDSDLVAGALAAGLPASAKKQLAATLKGARGTSTLYLDDRDLSLKAESVVTGSAKSDVSTTITYSGWGEPVAITAPPAGDVVDPKALGG